MIKMIIQLSLLCCIFRLQGQQNKKVSAQVDSLQGFDEQFMLSVAKSRAIEKVDMPGFMAAAKRDYIKSKYQIGSVSIKQENSKILSPWGINDDFEDQSLTNPVPSTVGITSSTGIVGWTAMRGTVSGINAGCNSPGMTLTSPPNALWVMSSTLGTIDPIIGPSYPIHSVFGNYANPGTNPPLGVDTMRGVWFLKLNNNLAGGDIHRVSTTFSVLPSNCIFKFAAIAVNEANECCCDRASFILSVKDCSNNLIPCMQYSIGGPLQPGTCSGGSSLSCLSPSSIPVQTSSINPNWTYNQWDVRRIDLSPLIGSCVTIDVSSQDCSLGGHAGYAYFDAQCEPMYLIMCGITYVLAPSITVSSCGISTGTLTAPSGLAPYQWLGPPGFSPTTAQTITTNIPGTYTLTCGGWGSCPPTVKYVTFNNAPPSAINIASSNSVLCSGSTATLSASGATSYTWNTGAMTNPINITPSVTTIYTVTGTDANNCMATSTFTQVVTTCTRISPGEDQIVFLLYPNPNKGEFTLKIEKELKGEIVIENMLGQIVFRQAISGGESKIKTKELAHGVYNYKIVENKTTVGKGKLVIE